MNLTAEQYLLLGYVVGLGVLLGYAAKLWLSARSLKLREAQRQED